MRKHKLDVKNNKPNLEDEITQLNKLLDKTQNSNSNYISDKFKYARQIKKNESKEKSDDAEDLKNHKEKINGYISKELRFKQIARLVSVVGFLILSFIIIVNLFLLLYWNPVNISDRVLIVITIATFTNLFALITVVFKYIFSPTKDMLEYNTNILEKKNE